jgi:four helix bundle protein
MSEIQTHRDLIVWQKAVQLCAMIAALTKRLPPEERYGLAAQVLRSARSIHANIAEGHGRRTRKDFLHFLTMANGSLQETDSHLAEALACGLLSQEEARPALDLIVEIRKMLCRLRAKIYARPSG